MNNMNNNDHITQYPPFNFNASIRETLPTYNDRLNSDVMRPFVKDDEVDWGVDNDAEQY